MFFFFFSDAESSDFGSWLQSLAGMNTIKNSGFFEECTMTEMYHWLSTYLPYIAPPLIGALIGYLTNKIAIRMLFRPLKPWYLFTFRVPMTPGVIPSKRHLLAVNIGKMVGTHLLTGKEIGRALRRQSFQKHLAGLIESRVSAIFAKNLAPLPKLIPQQYSHYFTIAIKTIAYQIRLQIHGVIRSRNFEAGLEARVSEVTAELLSRDIDSFIDRDGRKMCYRAMERHIKGIVDGENLEQWIEDILYAEVNKTLQSGSSLRQILPDSLTQLTLAAIDKKIPELLNKLAEISEDPHVQDRIVEGITKAIERFASSLGPMASMVQSFLSPDKIEKNVKEYLQNNRDEIQAWLSSDEVRERVAKIVMERVQHYLDMPVASFFPEHSDKDIRSICTAVTRQLAAMLRQEGVSTTISAFIADSIERTIEGGNMDLGALVVDVSGEKGRDDCRRLAAKAVLSFVRSQQLRGLIDATVNSLLASLLRKPVGKLADLLPAGVRKGIYAQIHSMSLAMLATEVPGLVSSLNIEQIVTEKVDSLDLLRLERLLLSIMEEQFKYINLFGALLGFLIGALNVILLSLF